MLPWFPLSIPVGERGTEAWLCRPLTSGRRNVACKAQPSMSYQDTTLLNCKLSAHSTLFHTMQTCSLLENAGNTAELLTVLKTYQNYIAHIFCYNAVNDCVSLQMNEPSFSCKQNFLIVSSSFISTLIKEKLS